MKATLTIQEKGAQEGRKRIVTLTADSVTVGTTPASDIRVETVSSDFILEIKQSGKQWWLINPLRLRGLKVNGGAIALERELKDGDQIGILNQIISFSCKEEVREKKEIRFQKSPSTDEELWNFLLFEKEYDEILINGPSQIIVDFKGVLYPSPYKFKTENFLIQKIKESSPSQDPSGWFSWQVNRLLRIHGALPPLTKEAHLSIRKAKAHVLNLEALEKSGSGTAEQFRFLKRALSEQQTILISGGTSTGKTVFLRSLIEKIPTDERILMIEEEAETTWPHPHCVAIEAGRGNLQQAVIECLRMRPNRLIVSEVRGIEAFDMLQAMNTGHPGSMTTIHANSTREALIRLETLALMHSTTLTSQIVKRQIAQAIDIIVQLERTSSGERRIKEIVRLTGIQNETLLLSDPVELEADGIEQRLHAISNRPTKKRRSE